MLPEKVIVAGIDYEIAEVDTVILNGSTEYAGSVNYPDSRIEILERLSNSKKEQTLVHEMLHACFHEAGFIDHEEDMVNRLGIVLYQVLKDNKLYFGNADTAER